MERSKEAIRLTELHKCDVPSRLFRFALRKEYSSKSYSSCPLPKYKLYSFLFASSCSAFVSSIPASSSSSSSSPNRLLFISSIFLISPSKSSTAPPGLLSELSEVEVEINPLALGGRLKVGEGMG